MSKEHSYSSNDLDQVEIIEEQIKKKVDQIQDMQQLNKVSQMNEDQIFNNEDIAKETKTPDDEPEQDTPEEEDDLSDEEDFECDIERYVKFEDKIDFAEKLKQVPKDGLTKIIKIVQELQPQALDDYGNNRLQLKIDMIERPAFLKCREVLNLSTQIKRVKEESPRVVEEPNAIHIPINN